MFTGAMVDCRRDSLWQKLLLETEGSNQGLTHVEFLELISLVHHETLDKVKDIVDNAISQYLLLTV